MKLTPLLYLILLIVASFCFSCGDDDNAIQEDCISEVINNYGLHLEGDGDPVTEETTLPDQLTDANWGLKAIVCEQGGYDLNAYTGQRISLTKYRIIEICDGEPLYLWILTNEDECICAYKTVREDSSAAPGVFAVEGCD